MDIDKVDVDITEESQVETTNYEDELASRYNKRFAGRTLSEFRSISPAVTSARMQQYPMDSDTLQTAKVKMLSTTEDPQKAWLTYYQGAYVRRTGSFKRSLATAPGTIDMVMKKRR